MVKKAKITVDMITIKDSGELNPKKTREYIPRAMKKMDTKKT